METLKSRYSVVFDERKFGGKRRYISINQLENYIPERSNFAYWKILHNDTFPLNIKVQNRGHIRVYLK